MAIISFDKDVLIDYIPAYGGNRDSEDPCVVRLKFVPYSRVQEYSRLLAARAGGTTGDAVKAVNLSQSVQKKQFVENVASVSGYYIGEREVEGAEEFYESADTELVTEIIRAMENIHKLSEGQRKN
jgi:hypothetical protein